MSVNNLIGAATKAIEDGSAVQMRRQTIPKWKPGSNVVITIEDIESARTVVKDHLLATNLKLTTKNFKVAKRALNWIEEHWIEKIDLIVVDYHLSTDDMNGIEFIRQLRKTERVSHIPVMMLTSESDSDIQRQAKAAGATAYFTKPIQRALAPEIFSSLILMSRSQQQQVEILQKLMDAIGSRDITTTTKMLAQTGECILLPIEKIERLRAIAGIISTVGIEASKMMVDLPSLKSRVFED